MSDPSLVQDAGLLVDGCMSFDHSVLDQNIVYPADMSQLPTSTPNPGNLRRKSRRSWFETTPKGFKFEIAVDKVETDKPKLSRAKSDTVEVLTLTHFSGAPRLGFGTMKIGEEKTCTLLLRNPHDYQQTVKVEKVPEKKYFTVPCKEFVVGPEESYPLEVTWAPKEAGGFREMIMMQVDSAYRVQAYVFGTVTAPPPQKKKTKRVGLLASKATKPFSVIQTASLASINHEYSPDKNMATESRRQPTARVRDQQITKAAKPVVNQKGPGIAKVMGSKLSPSKGRRSSGGNKRSSGGQRSSGGLRKSPRLSGKLQSDKENKENFQPKQVSKNLRQTNQLRKSSESKDASSKPNVDENVPRKKMRRSNTYNNISVCGLPVPIIQGETVKGHRNSGIFNIDSCNISGVQVLEDSIISSEVNTMVETKPKQNAILNESFIKSESNTMVGSMRRENMSGPACNQEPSFLEPGERTFIRVTRSKTTNLTSNLEPIFLANEPEIIVKASSTTVSNPEPSFLEKDSRHGEEPSFLEPCQRLEIKKGALTALKMCETYHDSLEAENASVEAPSFLRSEDLALIKQTRSLRKRNGRIEEFDKDGQPTGVKLLRSAKRKSGRVVINPDTFVKDVTPKLENKHRRSLSDTHKPLNDSVGQSTLLEQLKSLRTFVHDKSIEIEKSGGESFLAGEDKENCKELQRRETFVKCKASPRFSVPGSNVDIRRVTFVTDASKLKLLETQQPSEASPRRTTFTVVKGPVLVKPVAPLSDLTSNAALLEEEETEEELNNENLGKALKGNVQELDKEAYQETKNTNVTRKTARQYSDDSLESESNSFEKQTDSPDKIFTEQPQGFTRRATLTVVKSRPSDALMEYARKSDAAMMRLFDSSPEKHVETIPEVDEVASETGGKQGRRKSSRNNTFEVPAETSILINKDSSFPSTPHHMLPTSPEHNHSRRSTHVVQKPKIRNLSNGKEKRLFVEDLDQPSVSDLAPKDSVMVEMDSVASEFLTEVGNCSSEVFENESVTENQPASRGRRRTLSARRRSARLRKQSNSGTKGSESTENSQDTFSANEENSVGTRMSASELAPIGNDKVEVPNHQASESEVTDPAASGQLFFVAFDNKEDTESAPKRLSQRPDPTRYLKKRSNPVTQDVDRRTKRVKSEDTYPVPTRPLNQTTVQARKKVFSERGTKNTVRHAGSAAKESKMKPGLKPRTSSVMGLAQSKLILSKKTKSAIPKHPLMFAARNMFYDERWMEKQERGFVNWLNFILTPPEEHQGSDIKVKVDAGKLTLDIEKGRFRLAPTNEILSFRLYSAQRKLNRLRKTSCWLFQSDPVRRVMLKLEEEVESNRLLVRKDKMLHADVGAKQKILDMLLSYNPLWLRIGLETIYGEVVPIQSNTDVYGLSRFVIVRLLANPDIAREYAHPTVPHLYRDGYAEATSKHTLKKFLMLVYFLDQAKEQRLIDHNPCLFCKNSDIKASKDLLLQFSRDFLSGEGDITRHLGYLGYKVTYAQTPLDEFDFAVQTLATDLRDGLRLTRVLEIICNKMELSKSLRVPAISRLQKIHNVEVVFKTLTEQNIQTGTVTVRDIVDGHRERTLSLLWMIILHYQISMVINVQHLKEECEILEKSLKVKNKLHQLINYDSGNVKRRESEGPDLHTQDERLNLLLKWCRAVCAIFNIKIENFTVSFSDGRALCHILHYYHPGLLPLDQIHNETSITHLENLEKTCQQNLNCSMNDSTCSSTVFGEIEDPAVFEHLLANEKENFKLLSEKVKELGGVPLMLRWSDMSNTIPDEKVVVTYLMYLCARLLDIRHESRAARVIQHAWMAYKLKKIQEEHKVKSKAAVVIQRAVMRFLMVRLEGRRQSAALCIQRVYRGHLGRKEARQLRLENSLKQQMEAVKLVQAAVKRYLYRRRFLQMKSSFVQLQACCHGYLLRKKLHEAATTIQRVYRGYQVRKNIKVMNSAVTKIQACWRGTQARKMVAKQTTAVNVIQRRFKGYLLMKKQQSHYQTARKAATKIQACVRGHIQRMRYSKMRNSIVCLQAKIRGCQQRRKFQATKSAIVLIQNRFRVYLVAKQQRKEYLEARKRVIFLQSQRRMVSQRRKFLSLCRSAEKLQALGRMLIQRREFQRTRSAALTIQRQYRAVLAGRECRRKFLTAVGAAITVQAVYRGHRVRKMFRNFTSAAVIIQKKVRCFQAKQRFLALKKAAVVCQHRFRAQLAGRVERQKYSRLRNAAVVMQKMYRGQKCRKSFVKDRNSIIKAQSYVRMFLCKRRFSQIRQAVSVLQMRYRAKQIGKVCRQEYLIKVGAVITLQAGVRGLICRKRYRATRRDIIAIQAQVRGHIQLTKYKKLREGALTIQRRFKETLVAKQQRSKFIKKKAAAIVIQSCFRMKKERDRFINLRKATIVVQSVVRKFLGQRRFLKLKCAAMTLEKYYIAKVRGKTCRRQFLITKGAAITLQAAFRGYQARKELKKKCHAAIRIQAFYRGHVQKRKYVQLKNAAVKCQRRYRSKVMVRQHQAMYAQVQKSAIILQAAVRGFILHRRYVSMQKNAVIIQSHVRGMLQQKKYRKLRSAICTIQKYFRAKLHVDSCRKQFLIARGAAMTIQAWFRGHQVRKHLKKQTRAAVKIQSSFRSYIQHRQFQQLRMAACSLQKYWRARKVGENCRQHFLIAKGAAMTIQAWFRGHRVRKHVKKQTQATVTIQSAFRCHLQRRRLQNIKSAACVLQKHWRARQIGESCRRHFLVSRGAAMTIQAFYRGHLVRTQIRQQSQAAVVIQSALRCSRQRREFKNLKNAAVLFQRTYRAKLIGRKFQGQYAVAKKAAVCIQTAFRSWKCRREFKRSRECIIKVQAFSRMCAARREFLQQKQAARVIQNWFRSVKLTNEMRRNYLVKKGAAITVQAYVKMYIIRRLYLKTVLTRKTKAATKIQSMFRMCLARKKFHMLKNAAIKIQQHYKAKRCGKIQRQKFLSLCTSAVKIQTHFRRLHCQRVFRKQRHSAVLIQAWFRGIQARQQFLQMKKAAVALQTRWRAELLCRKHVMQYQVLKDSAITIQSAFRGRLARDRFKKLKAAVKIQSYSRMLVKRREFRKLRESVIRIQSGIRVWQARKQLAVLRQGHKQQRAVVTMQSAVRIWIARKRLASLKREKMRYNAVVRIQSALRVWWAKKQLATLRAAWLSKREQHLQKFTKMAQFNMAVTKVQRCYRNYRMMKTARQRLESIIDIQRWFRSKLARLQYLHKRRQVIRLQSKVRTWLARRDRAARVIQRAARHWMGLADVRKQHRASLKIQTLWRGYCIRKNIKSRRLTMVRQRVQEATALATEEKKLGNRTSCALDFLLKYKKLSQIQEALVHLDVATRLSWICCEKMVETNAIPVLYTLIKGCNRSLPHMELIKLTISILTNLAKYEKTRAPVYSAEGGIAVIVEVMQIYREKPALFNKICTLLGILALEAPCKMSILEDKKLVERLRSIQTLTARKHKLEETQRVTRARINSSSINATFSVQSPIKKQKIKPEWSLNKDKMNEIENPLRAINFVLENIGIKGNNK